MVSMIIIVSFFAVNLALVVIADAFGRHMKEEDEKKKKKSQVEMPHRTTLSGLLLLEGMLVESSTGHGSRY